MNNLCIIATLSYLTVLVPLGFVLKISIVWFGFAAGVGFEAVAMPRRQRFSSYSGAMPLVLALLPICWATGRTRGVAQR